MASQVVTFLVLVLVGVVNSHSEGENKAVDFRRAFDQGLYKDVLDPGLCNEQLTLLENHALRFQFFDASAKIPSGILTGNLNDLGDYHQCLSINQVIDQMPIQGKYCALTVPLDQNPILIPELPDLPDIPWPQVDSETADVMQKYSRVQRYAHSISGLHEPVDPRAFPMQITASLGMTMAVCVPKVCSPRQAIQFVQDRIPFVNLTYQEFFCRLPDDKPWTPVDYVAIAILSIIGLLITVSTTYDLCHLFLWKRNASEASNLYCCFSIYTNTRRFLNFKSSAGALECVDGIRAISMMWVIVGHTHSLTLTGYIHNLQGILTWMTNFSSVWVNSAPITVDTFFMLSGMLVVYTLVGKINRSHFLWSLHLFYLNRLLRMFPLLAAVVLLQASLVHHMSDGPFWVNVASSAQNCRQWWWSALLHVQNYVNPWEICLGQTWYLSVDVQLYLVSPLVLVWLFGTKPVALIALTAAILLSLVSSSLYSFIFNFSAAIANPARMAEFADYFKTYYMNTLARAPPFFIGMAYGYLLFQWRDRKIRIPQTHAIALWALSFVMMAFCIFSMYPVMQMDHNAQVFDNFLNAYMRAIWAIALGWLIFGCVQGYGGPINWFLSLKMWKLPARLSYAMYLVHFPIMMVANGSWVKTHFFTPEETMYRFMSDLMFSFIAAFILCIAIDAPFSTLQKVLTGKGSTNLRKPKTESQQNITEDDKYIKTAL